MLSELRNKDILSVIKGLLYTALGISFYIYSLRANINYMWPLDMNYFYS